MNAVDSPAGSDPDNTGEPEQELFDGKILYDHTNKIQKRKIMYTSMTSGVMNYVEYEFKKYGFLQNSEKYKIEDIF